MSFNSEVDPGVPPNSGEGQPTLRAIGMVLGLLLVLTGQFFFYVFPPDQSAGVTWGLALSLAGTALFVVATVGRIPARAEAWVTRRPVPPALLWLGAAILFCVLTAGADAAFERSNQTDYLPVVFLWLGAAVCYVMALALGWRGRDWRAWARAHRAELLLVGGLVLIAAGLRFYALGAIPRIINGDEGVLGKAALLTDRLPLASPFALSANFGGLYLQLMNVGLKVFGHSPFALRLLPAVGGTLAIPAVYLLTRRLFGVRPAILAAALIAASHFHLHFSRTVAVGYIQDTWLMPLELYLLISGLENRSPLRAGLGGLVLGLHFSVYLGAQVSAAFILVYLLVAAVVCRPLVQRSGRAVLAFWGGVGLMALPQTLYNWRHPDEFLARLNADGIWQSGWLGRTMADSGQNVVQVLAGRVVHVFLSLIYYPAIDFYGVFIPPLSLVAASLFLLGLGLTLWRTRDYRYLLLNAYFWAIIVSIGLFSIPPTADSYRVLMALPVALMMAGLGLDRLLTMAAPPTTRRWQWTWAGLAAFVLVGLLTINVWTYTVDFSGRCRYGGDPQTRFASYLGRYLGQLERDTDVTLLSDDVFSYGTHSSVDFLSNNFPVKNVPEPVASLTYELHSAIIAPATRAAALKAWAAEHPGGALHYEYDCNTLMMLVYRIP
jgi:hypothetical protein